MSAVKSSGCSVTLLYFTVTVSIAVCFASNNDPSFIPLTSKPIAGLLLSGTFILSNFASISPSLDTVTSYCIVSPGLVNLVLKVAVVSV